MRGSRKNTSWNYYVIRSRVSSLREIIIKPLTSRYACTVNLGHSSIMTQHPRWPAQVTLNALLRPWHQAITQTSVCVKLVTRLEHIVNRDGNIKKTVWCPCRHSCNSVLLHRRWRVSVVGMQDPTTGCGSLWSKWYYLCGLRNPNGLDQYSGTGFEKPCFFIICAVDFYKSFSFLFYYLWQVIETSEVVSNV